jgi:hypothetical protein
MNVPDSHMPEKMNWVDYCDALRGRQFFPRAQAQKPVPVSEHLADAAPAPITRKEVVRESV